MTKPADPSQLLLKDELERLMRRGVSASSTGLAFTRDLGERDLRDVWGGVAAIRRRSANADWTNWLVGDWANEATRRLGEGADWQIIREEETEFLFTQHLWRLTGATLHSLQLTELSIGLCSRFLVPEQMELAPGTVFNVDAEVRRKTLGQFSKLLQGRQIFIEAFEQRMDRFVEHRNRFAHRLWVDANGDRQEDHTSRMAILKSRERFMLDLLAESDSIGKIFKGLFIAIGVSIADQKQVAALDDEWADWASHVAEFEGVRRASESTA